MIVKNVSIYLPVKTESNAHFHKHSNSTKKNERFTRGLHLNVTRMRVIFKINARGLLTVEDGSSSPGTSYQTGLNPPHKKTRGKSLFHTI